MTDFEKIIIFVVGFIVFWLFRLLFNKIEQIEELYIRFSLKIVLTSFTLVGWITFIELLVK